MMTKRSYTRGRGKTTHVKTAKMRKSSSTRWLKRQLNDPFVRQAKEMGYRSRAVFKLKQLDDQYHFLKKGAVIVDLGAAPGGWLQLAAERTKPEHHGGKIIGIDLLEIDPLPHTTFFQGDFMEQQACDQIIELLGGRKVDVVLSDMAANTTGHQGTDHLRIMALVEMVWDFAKVFLADGGTLVAKVFQGGTGSELLTEMKTHFETVKHIKPQASRKESPETYLIAHGFKGQK